MFKVLDDDWRLRDLTWYGTIEDDAHDFEWVDAIPDLEAAGYEVFGEQPKGNS